MAFEQLLLFLSMLIVHLCEFSYYVYLFSCFEQQQVSGLMFFLWIYISVDGG